ncbi:MAG: NADH-quinone oxidoreductase subunit K [Ignavibacteriales bacterium]|nr:NADH-quinone oxidoreductase subunit K [Ignavibacteriales bacterium]
MRKDGLLFHRDEMYLDGEAPPGTPLRRLPEDASDRRCARFRPSSPSWPSRRPSWSSSRRTSCTASSTWPSPSWPRPGSSSACRPSTWGPSRSSSTPAASSSSISSSSSSSTSRRSSRSAGRSWPRSSSWPCPWPRASRSPGCLVAGGFPAAGATGEGQGFRGAWPRRSSPPISSPSSWPRSCSWPCSSGPSSSPGGSSSMIPTEAVVVLGLLLFAIGFVGVVVRKNLVVMLMSLELLLNGANVILVGLRPSPRLAARLDLRPVRHHHGRVRSGRRVRPGPGLFPPEEELRRRRPRRAQGIADVRR